MARVLLQDGIAGISGTLGNMTFRTMNGKTFVRSKVRKELPPDATRAEKKAYQRAEIINQCVEILQQEIGDWREAIKARERIRKRVIYHYEKYAPEIRARTKLQAKILCECQKETKYPRKTHVENP